MADKRSQSRKYKAKDEFRKNYGKFSKGHPAYIFGEKTANNKTKYKYFGITHNADDPYPKLKLDKNPDPSDPRDSYLKTQVRTAPSEHFGPVLNDWAFNKRDRSVVRHLTKKYKKKK